MKKLVKKAFEHLGYSITKNNVFTSSAIRLKKILENNDIDLFIDVGANKGQFLKSQASVLGNVKTIIVEPIEEYREIYSKIGYGKILAVVNKCISSKANSITLNLTENDVCSSTLIPKESSKKTYIGLDTKTIREVGTVRLDELIELYFPDCKRIFLKLDVQGTEVDALNTLDKYSDRLACIRIEASFVPLYEGQDLFEDILQHSCLSNFNIVDIDVVAANSVTGELEQIDLTMVKR